jgi:hypothetical protein
MIKSLSGICLDQLVGQVLWNRLVEDGDAALLQHCSEYLTEAGLKSLERSGPFILMR